MMVDAAPPGSTIHRRTLTKYVFAFMVGDFSSVYCFRFCFAKGNVADISLSRTMASLDFACDTSGILEHSLAIALKQPYLSSHPKGCIQFV